MTEVSDPYGDFPFRLRWETRPVAGFRAVTPLSRRTEVVAHREGGDPGATRKSPGRTDYEPVTLEGAVTHDTEFETWAGLIVDGGPAPGVPLQGFRRDLVLELYDRAGHLAVAYRLHRCWVSEYQVLPELDANGNGVAVQRIKLENEGWERMHEVP